MLDESATEESARLRRMLSDLNELIEMLWLEVEDLRRELATARGQGDVPGMYTKPPTQPGDSSYETPDDALPGLRRMVDEANVAADALWFESQWMRSQLAAVVERP